MAYGFSPWTFVCIMLSFLSFRMRSEQLTNAENNNLKYESRAVIVLKVAAKMQPQKQRLMEI